ncbi:MAG: isopentenyl-diphosphate Delta-isomerase [Opitutaceae bacterium]
MPRAASPSTPSPRAGRAAAAPGVALRRPSPDDLILVDRRNRRMGRADKATVHAQGLRHRAFSIFLVDASGRLLLQQRNRQKYHSGGLWANSCCGHPSPGERTLTAARRRLHEELGVRVPLRFGFLTHYRTHFPNGLQENEVVHVYFGPAPDQVQPDPKEVMGLAMHSLADLTRSASAHPERYAFWLRHYLTHHHPALAAGVKRAQRSA